MAEPAESSGGGNAFIYFVIGALVVAVAVIAWIALANNGSQSADVSVDLPDAPNVQVPAPPSPGGDVDVNVDAGGDGQ